MRTMHFSLSLLAFAASAAAQATWWVSPAGNNANAGTFASPFQTINHANTVATPGDTIRLLPGVFGNEQGHILLGNKDIAVVGSGVGATIINPHSTWLKNLPTGFPAAPVLTLQRAGIVVWGNANVDLRGFTVDGTFNVPASGRLTGIYYLGGADGLISDVEIRNCRNNPLNLTQGTAGIVVRGDNSLDPCRVRVRNTHLHNWGKVGIAAFFNADVVVEDSRIVGADRVGVSGPAQNGIQYGYGAQGGVYRTAIADIFYSPATNVACGILGYDAGPLLEFVDNGIANCQVGLYLYGLSSTASSAQLRRNRMVACESGVFLDNVTGCLVADNHLQLSLDAYANAAFANLAGNAWADNNYSSYSGAGSYTIPGGSGAVDLTPRRGVDLFVPTPVVTALPAGHIGRALVVAQLDGSGGSDFASFEENAGISLTVGLNTGGSFATVNLPFAATGRPVAAVAAQLDGNPGLDLAVVLQVTAPAPGARVITFANNGVGGFSVLGSQFLAGVLPAGLAAGDIDNDGIADLALANIGGISGGDALLLRNQVPFGTSFAVTQVPVAGFYAAAVRGVAIADVNGDGFRDIVATEGNAFSGLLHIALGDGSGNFAPAAGSPLVTLADPTAVAAGDLDGDGDVDLLVSVGTTANVTPGGVVVLENLGSLNFRRSRYASDFGSNALVVGNLDADSDPDSTFGDVAVLNTDGGRISVLGAFVQGAGFTHGGFAVKGATPSAVAFGNFDNDGFDDLFYSTGVGGQVVVLRGRPSARVDYFGSGTEGYRAKIPYLRPIGAPAAPVQPNLGLSVELSNGREFTLSALIVTLAPAPVLVPNNFMVDISTSLATFLAVTDIQGKFSVGFGIPAGPAVRGLSLYFQGGVLDTIGNFAWFPGVATSNGMKWRIGW